MTSAQSVIDSSSDAPTLPGSPSQRRALTWRRRLVYSLLPVTLLLIVVELLARCCGTGANASNQRFDQIEEIVVYLGSSPGQSIFEPDPDCFWRLKPNVFLPLNGNRLWSGKMSNAHGLRSREVTLNAAFARRRVLCFGDSTTFAFGVPFDSAWPNQLQQQLDQQQPGTFEVLNAGIPGQTTYQGRQRLTRTLKQWRPEVAFITFGNNDGWRWDEREDKDHATSSANHMRWMRHSAALSAMINIVQSKQRTRQAKQELQWAHHASMNYFDPNLQWTPRVSLDDYADNLRAMIDECRADDCEPVLVVWPDQRQLLMQPTWRVPYQEAMRRVAIEKEVRYLDLVPHLERTGAWGVQRFIPNDVIHLDHAGNGLVSDLVQQMLVKPVLRLGRGEFRPARDIRRIEVRRGD